MNDALGTPPPLRPSRKFRFALSACSVVIATFVGFLLFSGGRRRHPVQVHLAGLFTNEWNCVIATLSVTNEGNKRIALLSVASEIQSNGQWTQFNQTTLSPLPIRPGRFVNFSVSVPQDGRVWRGRGVWYYPPSDSAWRNSRLLQKAGALFRGTKLAPYVSLGIHYQTNYTSELDR
jgi:hypothetical protein